MDYQEKHLLDSQEARVGDDAEDYFNPSVDKLPKEFRKSIIENLDRRYLSILFSSIVLHALLAIYFMFNPPFKDSNRISLIQERLAQKLAKREVTLREPVAELQFPEPQPEDEEVLRATPGASSQASTSERRETTRTARAEAKPSADVGTGTGPGRERRSRGQSRKELAESVGSKGILALLTSTGSAASGEEVQDILGESEDSLGDLDETLGNVSGVKTGGDPEGRRGRGDSDSVKGGRTREGGGGIDGLVSRLGSTKSSSFERSGDLVVVNETPLIEDGEGKGIKGRNQDDIQAVVMKHNSAIQYCYERELRRNPSLKGKLVLRITITPQGTVRKVEIVSSTLGSPRVERCVVSRIRRWSDFGMIDPSYGDTTIRQTYAFGY